MVRLESRYTEWGDSVALAEVINVGKNAIDVRKAVALMPYSKVIINVAKTGSDEVISYEAGEETGNTLEFDCPWGTQEMADNLLAKLRGYQYQPYTVTSAIVSPAAEMGDAVQTNGVYGGIYQQDAQFGHTFYSDFSAPQDEQLDHEFTFETPVERRLSRQEAYTKSTFQIQHDNIEARVTQKGGDIEDQSFSWRLLSNEFGLYSGTRKVFTCNSSGIIVKGTVYADAGLIGAKYNSTSGEWEGGFHIAEKKMWSGQSTYDGSGEYDVAGVYLGTDGIGLGKSNFTVDKNGNLTAKSGTIGSDSTAGNRWQIGNKSIYKGTNSTSSTSQGVYLGTDGIRVYYDGTKSFTYTASNGTLKFLGGMSSLTDTSHNGAYIGNDGIALGGGKFKVDSTGEGQFRGDIHAKTGHIGATWNASTGSWGTDGFTIANKKLYNGTDSISSTTQGVYMGTDGIRLYYDSTKSFTFKSSNGNLAFLGGMTSLDDTANGAYLGNDGIALGGGKFKVTSAGELTAKSGTFTGTITATGGYIGTESSGFVISSDNIYNGTNSMSSTTAGVFVGTSGIRVYQSADYNYTFGKSSSTFKLCAGKSGIGNASNSQTEGVYIGTDGIAIGRINIGTGENPNYIDALSISKSGKLIAKSIEVSKDITFIDNNGTATTLDGAKLTDGSVADGKISGVAGSKVGSGINGGNLNKDSVPSSKFDSTTKTTHDHGGTAYDDWQSAFVNNTKRLSYLSVNNLAVQKSSNVWQYATWKDGLEVVTAVDFANEKVTTKNINAYLGYGQY